jgi:hypothetical protein
MAVQQAASLVDFASKHLIVITAGREHDAKWLSAQKDLATLSTNGRHHVVADATHASLLLDPTDATAVRRLRPSDTATQASSRMKRSRSHVAAPPHADSPSSPTIEITESTRDVAFRVT